jgi:hypothetical protein
MKKPNKFNDKFNNKFTIKNELILLFIITLIIVFPMICYYCYYYFYSIPKRRKNNVKTRMRVLTELYTMVVDIANENNVKPFLLYGSLLGQQRDNKIICYDFDVDMGILSTDFNNLYAGLKKKINTDKYSITLIDTFLYGTQIKIIDNKTSLNLDIDVYEKQPNGYFKKKINYVWFLYFKYVLKQCNKRDIPHDWLLPLRPVSFLKKNVYIPNNPGAFLECEYGKNYLTPDHTCNNDCTKCVKK